jgi:hypothetical protein
VALGVAMLPSLGSGHLNNLKKEYIIIIVKSRLVELQDLKRGYGYQMNKLQRIMMLLKRHLLVQISWQPNIG